MYKRALNNVKMVLYMQQKGIEVASRRFCAAYNLSMKLLQGNLYDNHGHVDILHGDFALKIDGWTK